MTPEERAAIPQDVLDDPTNPHFIPWRKWKSDIAKGMVLLALHEDREVEWLLADGVWTKATGNPRFWNDNPRRIPPAPKCAPLKLDGTNKVVATVELDADGKPIRETLEWVE